MHVSVAKSSSFHEFTISIIIESEADAEQLFALHDHRVLMDITPNVAHKEIRDCIQNGLGRCPNGFVVYHRRIGEYLK